MYLKKFVIENFRIFKDPVEFDFKPITILIGQNNSGKSTLLKALYVLKKNASLPESKFPIEIQSDLLSTSLGGLQHFLPIGEPKGSFKISFEFEIWPNPEYYLIQNFMHDSKLHLEYVSESSNNKMNCSNLLFHNNKFNFPIIKMSKNVDNLMGIEFENWFLPKNFLFEISSFLNKNKDGISYIIHTFYNNNNKDDIKQGYLANPKLMKDLCPFEVEGISYSFADLWNILRMLYSIEYFSEKYQESMQNTMYDKYLLFMDTLQNYLKDDLKIIYELCPYEFHKREGTLFPLHDFFRDCLEDYFNKFKAYFKEHFVNIESNRINPKRYYSPGDVDQLSELLFMNKFKKEDADEIIRDILGIADEIKVETIHGYLKKVVIRKNNIDFNLVDMSYGISQLLPFIINPDYDFESRYGDTEHTWLVSEPEANLHPSLQSKLADLFVHLYNSKHSRFIIETHSEYLIRKLQYLVKQPSSELQAKDVVIYYFFHPDEIPPGEKQIKKIEIDEDGNLSGNFGPGFYDESSRIAMDLWNMNASQKN